MDGTLELSIRQTLLGMIATGLPGTGFLPPADATGLLPVVKSQLIVWRMRVAGPSRFIRFPFSSFIFFKQKRLKDLPALCVFISQH